MRFEWVRGPARYAALTMICGLHEIIAPLCMWLQSQALCVTGRTRYRPGHACSNAHACLGTSMHACASTVVPPPSPCVLL